MICKSSQALRASQHQVPVRLQCVVECGNDPLLQFGTEINQQIPASDQVQIGKGRVLGHILAGEHAHLAKRLVDLVPAVQSGQTLERNICDRRLGVNAGPGAVERDLADVRRKNLNSLGGKRARSAATRLLP